MDGREIRDYESCRSRRDILQIPGATGKGRWSEPVRQVGHPFTGSLWASKTPAEKSGAGTSLEEYPFHSLRRTQHTRPCSVRIPEPTTKARPKRVYTTLPGCRRVHTAVLLGLSSCRLCQTRWPCWRRSVASNASGKKARMSRRTGRP